MRGFEERFVAAGGTRVRYLVSGSGDPIVLVHGLGGAASNWVELAPMLARRRRVLCPDLPGHDGSEPLPGEPNLAAYAECVVELMKAEGMRAASLVGHSFGASVALRVTIRHPGAVSGVVLAGAAGISSRRRLAQAVVTAIGLVRPGRLVARARDEVARTPWLRYPVFGYWGVADPRAFPASAVQGFLEPQLRHTDTRSAARALLAEDPRGELELVRCPALVLWGARDAMVPVADGVEYARRLRAPLRVIADCGHLLIGERPDACVDAIETFFDGIDGSDGGC
jgi:pimeloyl-ACP methyl ester carboxylesterase